MEIKSNFKDYYDFALSGIIYDIDKSVVYSRLLDVLKYNGNNIKNDNNSFKLSSGDKTIDKYKFYLYLDGEFYSGVQEVELIYHWNDPKILNKSYIYDSIPNIPEDVIKTMKELGEKYPIITLKKYNEVQKTCPDIHWTIPKDKRDRLTNEQTKIVMTNELKKGEYTYVINDSLKNIGFNKIMDATQVYQKIESFINRINSIEKEIEFNDIEKRDQHGFDDYSFKNM